VLLTKRAGRKNFEQGRRAGSIGTRCRPIIEDYHKGMKTGHGASSCPSFESADRLEPVDRRVERVGRRCLLTLRNAAPPARNRAHAGPPRSCRNCGTLLVASKAYRKPDKQLSVKEFFIGGRPARRATWLANMTGPARLDHAMGAAGENCI